MGFQKSLKAILFVAITFLCAVPFDRAHANDDLAIEVQSHLHALGLVSTATSAWSDVSERALARYLDMIGSSGSFDSFALERLRAAAAIARSRQVPSAEAIRLSEVALEAEIVLDEARRIGPGTGQTSEADELFEKSSDLYREAYGELSAEFQNALLQHGLFLLRNHELTRAEIKFRRLSTLSNRTYGERHYNTLLGQRWLGVALAYGQRYSEAEEIHRAVLEGRQNILGEFHKLTCQSMNDLGNALSGLQRTREATHIYNRIFKCESYDHNYTHHSIALEFIKLGEFQEAREHISQTSLPTDGVWQKFYSAQGDYESALRYNLAEIKRLIEVRGEGDNLVTFAYADEVMLLLRLGQYEQALRKLPRVLRRVSSYLLESEMVPDDERDERGVFEFEEFLSVMWQYPGDGDRDARATFEVAAVRTFGVSDVSLNDAAARRGVEDGAATAALRELQDAREAVQRLQRSYLASSIQDRSVNEEARSGIHSDLSAAKARLGSLVERIQRDFPALAELQFPRALEAEEAQALLAPGEGMLAYASTEEHLYAWLVTPEGIEWRRMDAPRADLAERVALLRASLDIDWRAPPPEVAPGCKLVSGTPELADWPFDLCAAEEMQETLLGDLDLSGIEELIVVPDGPLESLPFAMLVTDRAEDGRPRWLIKDHAITTLPTTSSLRALRQGATTPGADDRLPFLGLAPVEFDATSPDSALRGSPLAALPATDDEVRLISGLLGAGRAGTVVGAEASEAFTKSAPLDRYRVLSFATHGLLSREAARVTDGDISEMSLALRPGDGEDGMLTASEVAGLRLDADWVLLSACNTAGGDGDDAEGLSGLARAFFFAGARTLMVSHWYIDDAATSQLMADTMERSVTDDATSRAQALRQAQLAMLSQNDFAHPFYWAPFSVVGDNR